MSDTEEPQSICGFTGDDYAQVMADLLPSGIVWPRDPDTDLMRTVRGLADEFARVHDRDCDLLAEAYPPTATETITDWLRVCGLPSECTGPLETLQEQRDGVMNRLSSRGGQSRQYFIEGAAALGYEIDIIEFRPMLADQCRADDMCWHQSSGRLDESVRAVQDRRHDWWFVWRVVSRTPAKLTIFRADESCAGEPLEKYSNEMLECWIYENKPAHTMVSFSYAPHPPPNQGGYWDRGFSIWDGGQSIWDGQTYPRNR
jgi:uncharacterized protein YmfQ (DUF2313 family)